MHLCEPFENESSAFRIETTIDGSLHTANVPTPNCNGCFLPSCPNQFKGFNGRNKPCTDWTMAMASGNNTLSRPHSA